MSDLISRQAAIDATWFEPSYTDPLNVLTEVRDRLKALPSAQPEQDIEHCATCVHDEDSVEICVLRNCKYAIAELIDCYEPKQPECKKEEEHASKKG